MSRKKSQKLKYPIKKYLGQHSVRSIIAILLLGVSIGVAYEEFVGIGTWHSYHPATDKINICFTPPSGCGDLIAGEIAKAQHSIYAQAYGLTLNSIIYQLKTARNRGVLVNVILDNGNLSNNKSIYNELREAGIKVYLDKMPGIAHNKIIIIDGQKVITGSFNFTASANHKNAENVLLIEDSDVAELYLKNWLTRFEAAS